MALFTLTGELSELTTALDQLAALAKREGITFGTADYGGVRTEPDTVKILKYRDDDYAVYVAQERRAGRVPKAKEVFRPINDFGSSWHNYGAARDLSPVSWPASRSSAWALQRLAEIVRDNPRLGLRAGRWFARSDVPHFELAITLDEAKRRYQARLARGSL